MGDVQMSPMAERAQAWTLDLNQRSRACLVFLTSLLTQSHTGELLTAQGTVLCLNRVGNNTRNEKETLEDTGLGLQLV